VQDFTTAGMLHGRVIHPPAAGAKLLSVDEAGRWSQSTSPLGFVSVATIALVQPVVLLARAVRGAAFDESAVHLWAVLFLLSLSAGYAIAMTARMRRGRKPDAVAAAPPLG